MTWRTIPIWLALPLAHVFAAASAASPISVPVDEVYSHTIDRPTVRVAWVDATQKRFDHPWQFQVIVDEHGVVKSAVLKSGPAEHRMEAKRAALATRFRPFQRNGHAVSARLDLYVSGEPADYAGPADRTFPSNISPADVVIALSRSACFGTCPDYRVEIRGDGTVSYQGNMYTVVRGRHTWRVPQANVIDLIDRFRRADYFRLKGEYVVRVTDLPTYVSALTIGARRKVVVDYGGALDGGKTANMPASVTALEKAIDAQSGVTSWTTGDNYRISRLRQAHWDFHSAEAGRALNLLISDCKTSLAREFIRLGAPINIRRDQLTYGVSVVAAAHCGDVQLVRTLEAKGAFANPGVPKAFLQQSVYWGFPALVEIALQHYHDVQIKDNDGDPLIYAAASAYEKNPTAVAGSQFDPAKVVALLLRAGADPNAENGDGETPLFAAGANDVAIALLKGGANPNARNRNGQTPLFDKYLENVTVLVRGGADVHVRDFQGRTPLFGNTDADAVHSIVQAGVDVNAVAKDGGTALEAAQNENVAMVLLAAGAKLPVDQARLRAFIDKAKGEGWSKVIAAINCGGFTK